MKKVKLPHLDQRRLQTSKSQLLTHRSPYQLIQHIENMNRKNIQKYKNHMIETREVFSKKEKKQDSLSSMDEKSAFNKDSNSDHEEINQQTAETMFFLQEDGKINYGRFQLNHVVQDKVRNNLKRIKGMNAFMIQDSVLTNDKGGNMQSTDG